MQLNACESWEGRQEAGSRATNHLHHILDMLVQESADYGPRAKSSQPPSLVNKVLLELSHNRSFMYRLWLLSNCTGWGR